MPAEMDHGSAGKYIPTLESNNIELGSDTIYKGERKPSLAEKVVKTANFVSNTLPSTEGITEKRVQPSRQEPNGISNFEAWLQLTKMMLGTGILFMPSAFKMTGVWQGIVMTVAISTLTTIAYQYLIRASQHLCRVKQAQSYSYGETVTLTLKECPLTRPYSQAGKGTISILIILSTYTVAIVYMLMIAKNIFEICKWFQWTVQLRLGILIQLPLHLCTTNVKSMHRITPMTILAMVGLWTGYLLTTYNIVKELIVHGVKQTEKWASIERLPKFLSIAVFAYVGINAVNAIENNMRHPEAFIGCPSVSSVSVAFVGTVYGLYGLMGYLAFGDETEAPITSQFPQSDVLGNLLKLSISIGLAFSLPIVLYAAFEIVNDYLSVKLANTRWIWLSRRWAQISLIAVIPLIATDIEAVLQLIAIPCALLQFVIPFLVDSMLFWRTRTIANRVTTSLSNIIMALIGVSFVVIGMYFGVLELINSFK